MVCFQLPQPLYSSTTTTLLNKITVFAQKEELTVPQICTVWLSMQQGNSPLQWMQYL